MRVGNFDIPVHIPLLAGADEASLNEWKSELLSLLKALRLQRYIQQDVPRSRPTTSRACQEWIHQRANVQLILARSLSLNHISAAMKRIGWTPDEVNPRGTYLKALQVFAEDTPDRLLEEYTALRPSAFESFRYYVLHLQFLKDRLAFLDLPMDDNTHLWLALNAVKERYPDEHRHWVRMMKRGTMSWEVLMDAFSTLADREPDYNPTARNDSSSEDINMMEEASPVGFCLCSIIIARSPPSPEPFEPASSRLFLGKTRSGKGGSTNNPSVASSSRRLDSFDLSSLQRALAEISLAAESRPPPPTINLQANLKFNDAGIYEAVNNVASLPAPVKFTAMGCRPLPGPMFCGSSVWMNSRRAHWER
ncbi:hypothetical protein B0T19DRAFT_469375 [Cercophora scortea]|uniref:Uncharacterized protein n=1 Tax=Cercophora scortea TaxID=314031 RepID=A0AAE0M4J0_9PEZI|nr:hypothetical protein B0T19DRAFT_469375 [Cercophora scortea]